MTRLIVICLALGLAACGDTSKVDVKPDHDGGLNLDKRIILPPDHERGKDARSDLPFTKCDAQIIGKPCTEKGSECGAGHICLTTNAKGEGFCTCDCTVDDPDTPQVNEDTCPDLSGHLCAEVVLASGTRRGFCLKTCAPKLGSNDCGSPLACDPRSGGWLGAFGRAVCAFTGCKADAECPVITKTVCSVAQKSCGSGQTCVTYSGGDEGRCALAGACDMVSGLCTTHGHGNAAARVGDPCKDDTECAGNMRCSMEHDQVKYEKPSGAACNDGSECCSGGCTNNKCDPGYCLVLNRNGYCTIQGCQFASTLVQVACPTGSSCHLFAAVGGACLRTCALTTSTDCRGNAADLYGDYECRNWSGIAVGIAPPTPVAGEPTCEPGSLFVCDELQASKIDCTAVGADLSGKTNPTDMACRKLDSTKLSNIYDAAGFCLDTTASGASYRNPLPKP